MLRNPDAGEWQCLVGYTLQPYTLCLYPLVCKLVTYRSHKECYCGLREQSADFGMRQGVGRLHHRKLVEVLPDVPFLALLDQDFISRIGNIEIGEVSRLYFYRLCLPGQKVHLLVQESMAAV